jgi:hypothetical protein
MVRRSFRKHPIQTALAHSQNQMPSHAQPCWAARKIAGEVQHSAFYPGPERKPLETRDERELGLQRGEEPRFWAGTGMGAAEPGASGGGAGVFGSSTVISTSRRLS